MAAMNQKKSNKLHVFHSRIRGLILAAFNIY
jgi:hypothetical protein